MIDEELKQKIQEKREENAWFDGYILIFNNEIYGWRNKLRNPETEQPGSIAIDPDGKLWQATGGDPDNGAEKWTEL
jgi:hypothetical protein